MQTMTKSMVSESQLKVIKVLVAIQSTGKDVQFYQRLRTILL